MPDRDYAPSRDLLVDLIDQVEELRGGFGPVLEAMAAVRDFASAPLAMSVPACWLDLVADGQQTYLALPGSRCPGPALRATRYGAELALDLLYPDGFVARRALVAGPPLRSDLRRPAASCWPR